MLGEESSKQQMMLSVQNGCSASDTFFSRKTSVGVFVVVAVAFRNVL